MFRSFIIVFFIVMASVIWAVPDYYPTTVIAEELVNTTSAGCSDAFAGIDVLHNQFGAGEFISARYYSNSGALSNPYTENRVSYYNVSTFPTVKFNGTQTSIGGGANILNGSTYRNLLRAKLYLSSPIQLQIADFNSESGDIRVRATMKSSTYAITNQSLRFILLQNDVSGTATQVVREVISQPITLSGANEFVELTANFTSIVPDSRLEYWAAAIVQLDDKTIIQAASSLAQPQYQIRAVMPFNPTIVDSANYNFTSPTVYFYNTGLTENFTIKLINDGTPNDWYLNYCSENGECYVGSYPNPFTLAAGDTIGFHLNLMIGGSGIGSFYFLVESPNMEPYKVPFTYATPDTPNHDSYLPATEISLMQNYPNPFGNATSLKIFSQQASKPLTIDIFNVKGQLVRQINTGNLNKGISEITWNGKNSKGDRVPQGLYFSSVMVNGKTQTQKMLVLNK